MQATSRTSRNKPAPVSPVAARIVQAAVRADVTLAELGGLAERDPAFAMRILSMVNSSAFGLAFKVSDLRQAVSMLGLRGLRNLALSLALSDMVPMGQDGDVLLANSLRRAVAAKLLAEHLGEKQADAHFTTGLFLESGMLARARDDLAGTADLARSPAVHRVVRERAAGDMAHPFRGAQIASHFQLPPETVRAIEHHHDADPPDGTVERIAWMAERFAGVYEGGDLASNRKEAERAGAVMRLSREDVETILRKIPETVGSAAGGLSREVGPLPDLDQLLDDASQSLFELNRHYEHLVRTLEGLIVEKEALAARLQQANETLAKLAATDALTGLANKRAFEEALTRDLARAHRFEIPMSLVMIDVDHFKKVNDTFGHPMGDQVLRIIAQVVTRCVRAGDVPARYGGEEFAVLLANAPRDGARIVAERIRNGIESTSIQGDKGPLRVTASLGVATVSGPGCAAAGPDLVSKADAALYEAKRQGRNRTVIAT